MGDVIRRFRQDGRWVCSISLVCCIVGVLWATASRDAQPGDSTALFSAAHRGDNQAVERALASGVSVNAVESGSNMTPLMYAARFGHLKIAKFLLDRGADVRRSSLGYGSALAAAAAGGGVEMVRLLLAYGADPNQADYLGFTPLMHAVVAKDIESVKALLKAGADVNAKDYNRNTPLLHAAALGDEAMFRPLIEAGADIDARDRFGNTVTKALADALNGSSQSCVTNGLLELTNVVST